MILAFCFNSIPISEELETSEISISPSIICSKKLSKLVFNSVKFSVTNLLEIIFSVLLTISVSLDNFNSFFIAVSISLSLLVLVPVNDVV